MTEIEFLVEVLKSENISDALKNKLLTRIAEIDRSRKAEFQPFVPNMAPTLISPFNQCNHDFPSPWFGTVPPQCKKCGQTAQTITITSGGGNDRGGSAYSSTDIKLSN